MSSLKRIHLWSEQDASLETCQSKMERDTLSVDKVRSIIVCVRELTKVGSDPLLCKMRLVVKR